MNTIELETTIDQDGMITLRDLPFHVGDRVFIVINKLIELKTKYPPYSLRGTTYRYDNPTDPVAEDDWEALK